MQTDEEILKNEALGITEMDQITELYGQIKLQLYMNGVQAK